MIANIHYVCGSLPTVVDVLSLTFPITGFLVIPVMIQVTTRVDLITMILFPQRFMQFLPVIIFFSQEIVYYLSCWVFSIMGCGLIIVLVVNSVHN